MKIHDNTQCTEYNEPVLPDEKGNCSLCGAQINDDLPVTFSKSYAEWTPIQLTTELWHLAKDLHHKADEIESIANALMSKDVKAA